MATTGNDQTVNRLYAVHSAALRGYVTRLLHDAHLAEDVVQETMLRAWRHADRLDLDDRSAWPWLRRVAHNIAVDRIRAQRSRPTEVGEAAVHQATDNDHANRVVTAHVVGRAVRRLAPHQRAVLVQLYVAGDTASTAADSLGIPVGTVKSRLHHALTHLRRTLASAA